MSQTAPLRPAESGRRGPEGLRALDRATTVLYSLAAHPTGISLADLSRETGLTMTTAHRILASLRSKNLAREMSDGLHGVGIGTLVLSGAYLAGIDLRSEALPHLKELNEATGETCHLGMLTSPHVVYIEKLDSRHPVRMVSRVGSVMPAVRTAMGKAILSSASAEVVNRVLEDSRSQLGIVEDADAFAEQLQHDGAQGFSTDLEENEPGICCVGAAIFDQFGRSEAAVSVSTPVERFDANRLDEFGALVRGTADRISQALGYLTDVSIEAIRDQGPRGVADE